MQNVPRYQQYEPFTAFLTFFENYRFFSTIYWRNLKRVQIFNLWLRLKTFTQRKRLHICFKAHLCSWVKNHLEMIHELTTNLTLKNVDIVPFKKSCTTRVACLANGVIATHAFRMLFWWFIVMNSSMRKGELFGRPIAICFPFWNAIVSW